MGAMKNLAMELADRVMDFYESYIDYEDEPFSSEFEEYCDYYDFFFSAICYPDGEERQRIFNDINDEIEEYESGMYRNHSVEEWDEEVVEKARDILKCCLH